jgi:REP element-mobilizing transposase RayT
MYHRKSVRLPDNRYAIGTCLFVTIVTFERRPIFGTVTNGMMTHSREGVIAHDCLVSIEDHASVTMHALIVMPDHVHVMFEILGVPKDITVPREFGPMRPGTGPTIIAAYKSAVTRRIRAEVNGYQNRRIWQRGYYERIVRPDEVQRTIAYINLNAQRYRGM